MGDRIAGSTDLCHRENLSNKAVHGFNRVRNPAGLFPRLIHHVTNCAFCRLGLRRPFSAELPLVIEKSREAD
jgi:hypothetical protein